jgi:cobalamin-dependent methionine synthase I
MGSAIEARDADFIKKTAHDQHQAGADYIDINAGIFVKQEADYMKWLATTVQDAVDAIMTRFQGVHTICGLSNISSGLPMRKLINRTFAVMAMARGLDRLIVNPLDRQMMANLIPAETLGGRDEFYTNFLQDYREKKFEL